MGKPQKRLSATIPACLELKLNYNASRVFLFAKGWKSLAVIEALMFWIWIVNNDAELYNQMKENIKHVKYEDKPISKGII